MTWPTNLCGRVLCSICYYFISLKVHRCRHRANRMWRLLHAFDFYTFRTAEDLSTVFTNHRPFSVSHASKRTYSIVALVRFTEDVWKVRCWVVLTRVPSTKKQRKCLAKDGLGFPCTQTCFTRAQLWNKCWTLSRGNADWDHTGFFPSSFALEESWSGLWSMWG